MNSFNVFKEELCIIYRANIFSKAFISWIFILAIIIICPFIICYRTVDFWELENSFREQPDVTYLEEYLLVLDTDAGMRYWSTNPTANRLAPDNVKQTFTKWWEEDTNHDGIKDFLSLNISVPLRPSENIFSVQLVAALDYRLHKVCDLQIGGGIFVHHHSGLPISSLSIKADLEMVQRRPLVCGRRTNHPHVLQKGEEEEWSPETWRLKNIQREYWRRNVTTRLTNTYISSESGPTNSFEIDLTVLYTEQDSTYKATLWYTLKMAWMQYLSVLVIFVYLGREVKRWIFSNQILHTRAYISLHQREMMQEKLR